MSRRRSQRRDLGTAISLEDALSVMVVMFVLFVLFLVPLVNVDRARLAKAQSNTTFARVGGWLALHGQLGGARAYASAFSLEEDRVAIDERGDTTLLECLSADSLLTVIYHDRKSGNFGLLQSPKFSARVTFRAGKLRWSSLEGSWFPVADTVEYAGSPESQRMKESYLQWAESSRTY
jgi:hypothetical protein